MTGMRGEKEAQLGVELEELKDRYAVMEQALERHVALQRLVSGISTSFVDVPPDEMDGVIQHALASMGHFAQVDRSHVFLYREGGKVLDNTHEWCVETAASLRCERQGIVVEEALPYFACRVRMQDIFCVPDVEELPPEASKERAMLQDQGVRSLLLVPMAGHGASIGFLGFESVQAVRVWDDDTVALLRMVGEIFTNALSRKMHIEALDRERSLMDVLMDNIPDSIYFKDRDSRFILASRGMAELFRVDSPEQLVGKTDFDFFEAEHAQQAYDDEQEIIRTGKPIVGLMEKETWPGRPVSWVTSTKMPLRDSQGEIVGTFGISRDMTEYRRMENKLAVHAEMLEKANADLEARNQDLDEFTYVASHDLQEPLRKLAAYSEALAEDLAADKPEDVAYDLGVLTSAAQRMQTLVQDLLTLSRSGRQAMKWEKLPLADIVDWALGMLEVAIKETHAEITRDDLPVVRGDETLLTQLFQNLIGNSLKFRGSDPPRIALSAAQEGGEWVLSIADNGIGLKPEYAEQIFSPFKRLHTRHEYDGTGIGLAVARKVVERHGGRIWVESKPGQGSCFKFTLPGL